MAFNAGKRLGDNERWATTVSRTTDPTPPMAFYGQRGTLYDARTHLEDLYGLKFDESDEISEDEVDFTDSECIFLQRATVENGRVIHMNQTVASMSNHPSDMNVRIAGASGQPVGFGQTNIDRDGDAFDDEQELFPVPPTPNCSLASTPNLQGSSVSTPFAPADATDQFSSTADMDVNLLRLDDITPGAADGDPGNHVENLAKWRAYTANKSKSDVNPKQVAIKNLCAALEQESIFSPPVAHLVDAPFRQSHATPVFYTASPVSLVNKTAQDFARTTADREELRHGMDESIVLRVPLTTKNSSTWISDPADGECMTIMTMPFQALATPVMPPNFNPQTLELAGDAYEEELGPSWAVLTDAAAIPTDAPREDPEATAKRRELNNLQIAAKNRAILTAKSAFKLTRRFGGKIGSMGHEMLQDMVQNAMAARDSLGQTTHGTSRHYSSGGHAASI